MTHPSTPEPLSRDPTSGLHFISPAPCDPLPGSPTSQLQGLPEPRLFFLIVPTPPVGQLSWKSHSPDMLPSATARNPVSPSNSPKLRLLATTLRSFFQKPISRKGRALPLEELFEFEKPRLSRGAAPFEATPPNPRLIVQKPGLLEVCGTHSRGPRPTRSFIFVRPRSSPEELCLQA